MLHDAELERRSLSDAAQRADLATQRAALETRDQKVAEGETGMHGSLFSQIIAQRSVCKGSPSTQGFFFCLLHLNELPLRGEIPKTTTKLTHHTIGTEMKGKEIAVGLDSREANVTEGETRLAAAQGAVAVAKAEAERASAGGERLRDREARVNAQAAEIAEEAARLEEVRFWLPIAQVQPCCSCSWPFPVLAARL